MPDPETSPTLAEAAAEPRRVKGDEGEVEAHSLPDRIEAEHFEAAKAVRKRPHLALKRVKMISPGAAQ